MNHITSLSGIPTNLKRLPWGMPPSPLTGDLGGGEPAQLRMRPDGIVVQPWTSPQFDRTRGVTERA